MPPRKKTSATPATDPVARPAPTTGTLVPAPPPPPAAPTLSQRVFTADVKATLDAATTRLQRPLASDDEAVAHYTLLQWVKQRLAFVDKTVCGPLIAATKAAYDAARRQHKDLRAPFEALDATARQQLRAWEAEKAARAAEEAALAAAAQAAYAAADEIDGFVPDALVPADDAPPPALPTAVPTREVWRADVVDEDAVWAAVVRGDAPRSLFPFSQADADRLARAYKRELRVPGLRAVCDSTPIVY